jgi:hypothetical protein
MTQDEGNSGQDTSSRGSADRSMASLLPISYSVVARRLSVDCSAIDSQSAMALAYATELLRSIKHDMEDDRRAPHERGADMTHVD